MRSSGKRNYRNESRKTRERKRGVTARSQGVNTVAMPGERSSDREAGKARIETMWHNRRAGRRGDEKNERTPSRDLVNTQLYTLTILLLCEGHSLHLLKKKKKIRCKWTISSAWTTSQLQKKKNDLKIPHTHFFFFFSFYSAFSWYGCRSSPQFSLPRFFSAELSLLQLQSPAPGGSKERTVQFAHDATRKALLKFEKKKT